jgi:hypothetical protein
LNIFLTVSGRRASLNDTAPTVPPRCNIGGSSIERGASFCLRRVGLPEVPHDATVREKSDLTAAQAWSRRGLGASHHHDGDVPRNGHDILAGTVGSGDPSAGLGMARYAHHDVRFRALKNVPASTGTLSPSRLATERCLLVE